MKLIRYGEPGEEKTGVFIDNRHYDTSAFGEDYNEAFFATEGLSRLEKFLAENEGRLSLVPDNARLSHPIARPSKIVCIGLNYVDHASETGAAIPPEPVVFMKSTTAVCGPFDNVMLPKGSLKSDWEVELAVVIGKKASYIEEQHALNYVAGYVLHNDISERAYQLERSGTWDKGKGCDTFAPMGPYLTTPDEITDVNDLRLWLKLNGRIMQEGTTRNMIYKIPFLITYVSHFMTLLPGDVISTGTPAGVGMGIKPDAIYLAPGDIMELGIECLGSAKQMVVAMP